MAAKAPQGYGRNDRKRTAVKLWLVVVSANIAALFAAFYVATYLRAGAGNPDTLQKFNADIQMYAGASDSPDPEAYLAGWSCDNVPGEENGWTGRNVGAWCDPEYDALLARLSATSGAADRAALARTLNDMLVQQHVVVPLVDRGRVSAHANSLAGVRINAWDSELWNIAQWHRTSE